jgi:hypothetical protein
MIDKDGTQNKNIMTYLGTRTQANSILQIPPLYYEFFNITTPNDDVIEAFSNYIDAGGGFATTIPFERFAVTATKGIFEGATLVTIFYNPDLTRKVVITNENYMYSLPKQMSNNKEIVLYYSVILSKEVPISNGTSTEILNYTPTNSYTVTSNRYMQDENGNKNDNIITYLSYRTPANSTLEIPPQFYETLIITTPGGDKLQATAIYTDSGVGEITTVPFQDFPVDGGLGIFLDAKNVRVIYDNVNLTRKVIITNYFPDPNNLVLTKHISSKNQFPIILYYGTIISPLVPIPNLAILDMVVQSSTTCFGEIQTRYMIDENWVRNDNIITIFQLRLPDVNYIPFPKYNLVFANIRTPQKDQLNGYVCFINAEVQVPLAILKISVTSASGIFEGAKLATLYIDNITNKNKIVITN